MFTDILYNFISPVTGRVFADSNYVLVGNSNGIAIPSPILIDIRLEIANLHKQSGIVNAANFVIGSPNPLLPNAQVLSSLDDGFLYNTTGIVGVYNIIPLINLTKLTNGKMWVGDSFNRPKEVSVTSGPRGPRGYRGLPGESFYALMKQLFEELFGHDFGDFAASALEKLFEFWLESILQGRSGLTGLAGLAGLIGLAGMANNTTGISGLSGANVQATRSTRVINTNLNMSGHRIENLTQSPETDFSLVTAKWVEDLLNNNVEIKWQ